MRACPSGVALIFLGFCLACAHAEPPEQIGEQVGSAPPNQLSLLDVTIEVDKLAAIPEVAAGPRNVSFFNTTTSEWTCRVEGRGSTWKLDRPVPPNKAIAIDIIFTEGDYVLACDADKRALSRKLKVVGS